MLLLLPSTPDSFVHTGTAWALDLFYRAKVLLEVFGSPFMKSNNVVIALVVGYVIAASSSHEGNRYIVNDKIDAGECEQETAGPRAWLTIVQACSVGFKTQTLARRETHHAVSVVVVVVQKRPQ